MRTVLERIKTIILVYVAIFIGIFFLLRSILNLFDMEYRQWTYILGTIVFVIGTIAGVIQLLSRIKFSWLRILSYCVLTCAIVVSIPFSVIAFAFIFVTEHVVQKDEYKLVAYVDGFLKTNVYYFDYKSPFTQGKCLRLSEYYGDGAFDPIKPPNGVTHDVKSYVWYDDEGHRVSE